MSEYTAEDFKNAMFAVLPKYGLRAHKSAGESYWQRDGVKRATNAEMAEAGWRPVHEHNPHATNGWGGGALIGSPDDLSRLSNAVVPLTLDTLREAWENAEVPTEDTPIREGDELLIRPLRMTDTTRFEVTIAGSFWEGVWTEHEVAGPRVLHRAPQREPWQDLVDAIRQGPSVFGTPEDLAKMLHERGVRVTGGDET